MSSGIKRDNPNTWNCSSCTFENTLDDEKCSMCSQSSPFTTEKKLKRMDSKDNEGNLVCPSCTYKNKLTNIKCQICNATIIEGEEQIQKDQKSLSQSTLTSCKHCGFKNDNSNSQCVSCEQDLHAQHLSEQEQLQIDDDGDAPPEMRLCKICKCEVSSLIISRHERQCIQSQKIIQQLKEQNPQLHYGNQCLYCYQKSQIQLQDHYKICKNKNQFFQDAKSFDRLTSTQRNAIKFMYQNSEKQHYAAKPRVVKRIQSLGFKIHDIEAVHHYIQNYAPIIVHIHVSRYMQFFVKDTHYRNQFQTNTSSGSLSSSSRTNWENRMFSHKYAKASGFQRVKYGTVNLTNDPTGVQCCSGYGNSYFLLKQHVRKRCTFTDMDSSSPSSQIGVFKFGFHVLQRLTDPEIKAIIQGAKAMQVSSNVVSTYKQIQIHGPLQFSKDVERLYVNQIQLQDPKIMQMVKQFSKKHQVQYQIFKPRDLSSVPAGGIFSKGIPIHGFSARPPKRKSKVIRH